MKRDEFDHVIRAAAEIVQDELVVVGSQAILAQFPSAPAALLTSAELDLYPKNNPERADEIDGALGDGSPFHAAFDVYAHGVGPETATPPDGWEERLVRVDVPKAVRGHATAWCLEAHDLVLAKLAAGRQHDVEFAIEAVRAELVDPVRLVRTAELMPPAHRDRTRERLMGVIAQVNGI